MQWNYTFGGETFQVCFMQILSSLCGLVESAWLWISPEVRNRKGAESGLVWPKICEVFHLHYFGSNVNPCWLRQLLSVFYLVFTFNHYHTVDLHHNLFICLPRTGNDGGGCFQIPFMHHINFWSQNKTSGLAPTFQIFWYQHILLSFCHFVSWWQNQKPLGLRIENQDYHIYAHLTIFYAVCRRTMAAVLQARIAHLRFRLPLLTPILAPLQALG